jgi:xanthine dehydrogenase YagS FAD-binding subunit
MHAILGASEQCVAVHPSDMCVALAALDARVNVAGAGGARAIAFGNFHRLPGNTPDADSTLEPDEVVTSVDLPPWRFATHYTYLKVRDRLSYAFALVSVAAALELRNGRVESACLALGGVAHKPWRSAAAEAVLAGSRPRRTAFERAAEVALEGATGLSGNRFKIELARRTIVRALEQAGAATPQSPSKKSVN